MNITLYIACNPFICTILFGILESSEIILFKDLVGKIIRGKLFFALFRDFELNYLQDKLFK